MDRLEKEKLEKRRKETSLKTMYFNRFFIDPLRYSRFLLRKFILVMLSYDESESMGFTARN